MKNTLIAFDFDGTLINSGNDKVIHVMYSAYAACHATGFRQFLDLDDAPADLHRIMRTHIPNAGAPRFHQLAAIVNTIATGRREALDLQATDLDDALLQEYPTVKQTYNDIYSALNAAAAQHHWDVFPSAKPTLQELAQTCDLAIASGVTHDILIADLAHHNFDLDLFIDVRGADTDGGTNKADILTDLRSRGYRDILFVGDSTRDQQYAAQAGTKFYRIAHDADFPRLLDTLKTHLPDNRRPWQYTETDKAFFARKTIHLMQQLIAAHPLTPEQTTHYIHQ